jgi:HdeA/HdeB family
LLFRGRGLESCAIAVAGFLLSSAAQIAAQEQAVLGQGNVSCQTWTGDRNSESGEAKARVAWVLGYITAFNQYGSKLEGRLYSGRSTEQITASIDNYCSQHPTDNVYGASIALIEEFRRKIER